MRHGAYSVISDIDGVLHRASKRIPGATRFVSELQHSGRRYVFLTNSPDCSRRELRLALRSFGMNVPENHFYSAAQAMAEFLARHAHRPKVYLVGSRALRDELRRIGARFTEERAEFVIVASGGPYGKTEINKAIELIRKGGNFITANRELARLTEDGIQAGCGALTAPIEKATGCAAYVVGKPNHLMIRAVEKTMGISPTETLMIGDSLDTDIDVGMQAQMTTVLVLSGITSLQDLRQSAYKPDYVFKSVADLRLDQLP